uniref:BREFELDIN A ESTERASE n=1 Tax=Bacillus subtilis TaxID=1423 RepID=UPI0000111F80|nr:Chain A, BREFELDIN A ESTERASE [Bacillus subtilis]1JKM_B Chain B, BREFELDIN A ESTERASE [Bacillus subtilis]
YTPPGRLGDESSGPRTDPRFSPAMVEALATFGLDAVAAAPPVSASDDLPTVLAAVGASHDGFQAVYDSIALDLPTDRDDVETSTETILGVDGNEITLHVFRPAGVEGVLPGLVYTHGGGMTILTTDNRVHRRWCTDLAAAGSVVVMVDFRNAWTAEGHHPFPSGVEDCLAAVLWVDEHRESLGLSGVVVQGESGGGNLAIATTLLAKRRGRLDAIDGVYASIPYISGGYAWDHERRLTELPSLVENDGYFIENGGMALLVRAYDPTGEHAEDPIAWPYFASEDELRGLPPFVVAVNELDPLRDEGIAFARRLARAGVDVAARVNIGLVHGADVIFRHWLPAALESTVRDVAGFAADRARLR